MGTYLQQKAGMLQCVEALNLTHPELVLTTHKEYLQAGARLLETNSFGASTLRLERYGLAANAREINITAAQLARQAASSTPGVLVVGSVGPISLQGVDFFSLDKKTLLRHFTEHASALLEAGVDAVFLETISLLEEALVGLEAVRSVANGRPVGVMLAPSEAGRLAGGITIQEAFQRLADAGATVVGLNATLGPAGMLRVFTHLRPPQGVCLAAFPNAGKPQYLDGHYLFHATPEYFASKTTALLEYGVRILGGCIGTTPQHIRVLSDLLPQKWQAQKSRAKINLEKPASTATSPRVTFASDALSNKKTETILEMVAKRITTIVELDTPKFLPLEKYFSAAHRLQQAGADFISLADNALAILRNSNMAVGILLHQRGIRPLIHISCRDKNLLALQSELMGLHCLGLNHILIITGDPAKVGDHPSATSVYDVNSVGLIRLATSFNSGLTHAGRDLRERTNFIIGCSFNPNAKNLDNQFKKLESKLSAGAHFVMTQPVFDVSTVKMCASKLSQFGVPVFFGIMPILNEKNAEFLHNEVPGINIPTEIRKAFTGLDRKAAYELSIEHSLRLREAILEHFRGLYLITPFQRTDFIEPLIPRGPS